MSHEKELAYRYDLFITPNWRDRFDTLVNEKVELPAEGRILDVNCGTGAHAIELAERARKNGEVIGIESSAERVEIAQAKALAKHLKNIRFHQGLADDLPFGPDEFDAVIGDASMLPSDHIEDVLAEMVRVARSESRVVIKVATRGSFDEFFSVYWEALLSAGLVDEVWPELERMIADRKTVSDFETIATGAGLTQVESFSRREEFDYETANDFLTSPLIEDVFLREWLEILPEDRRADILTAIAETIDRERHNAQFYVSIKATLITGIK
jgi:ubiquinone/menaquinone biosynthesis C-methylase UbiE